MPRIRPATNPLSFHKPTGQYYVTRGGKRVYLGANQAEATEKYYRLLLGQPTKEKPPAVEPPFLTAIQLANRFLTTQQANWRDPKRTMRCYRDWLGRFLKDHPRLKAEEFTVEMFAAWKLSLKERGYAPETINHFLGAVRAMFRFAEDTDLLAKAPRLTRVRNEPKGAPGSAPKRLYSPEEIAKLLAAADLQVKSMLLLALNCGFGPKDVQDLLWDDFDRGRVTLPRSKTGVCQTFLLWPETREALRALRQHRDELVRRLAKRGRERSDGGHVFMTKFWRPWSKDAVAEQFRKLCKKADVVCHGLYRLRHCASTAMSLVANPHVQRRFMRHSQLQQQVTYTHVPDAEVDKALMQARTRLLPKPMEDQESNSEDAA